MEIEKNILAGGNSVFEVWEEAIVGEEIIPEEWTLEDFEQAIANAGGFEYKKMPRNSYWTPWPTGNGVPIPTNQLSKRLKYYLRKQRRGVFDI